MTLDFSSSPYYDDFDPTKNYYRILYKPGYSVQSRELNQSQTILQDQITKFADNIFAQNTPVQGGQVTVNLNCNSIQLQSSVNGAAVQVSNLIGLNVTDSTGTITAKVIAAAPATSATGLGDPPTLILSYKSGNTFGNNTPIFNSATGLQVATTGLSNPSNPSSVASISNGVFYITSNRVNSSGTTISEGIFVEVEPQTIILDKYDNSPNARIGLAVVESIVTSSIDPSLLDPAIGAANYQAPGADRYNIELQLQSRTLTLGDDSNFIELVRVVNGDIQKIVDGTSYNVLDDYFAKRDYETNGNYVVNNFKLTPKTNLADSSNSTYILSVGKGLAYVKGYRINNTSPLNLISNRARTTSNVSNNPVFLNYGNFLYVNTVRGANGSSFAVTQNQSVDFHCIPATSVDPSTANTYNSTLVAKGYIRGLVWDHDTNDSLANTYVYRAYVRDLQNQTLQGNAASSTSNTVTLPSYFSAYSNAYVGMTISVLSGTDIGEFKTITSYNGSTKTATVNSNWTVNPDTTSLMQLSFNTGSIQSLVSSTKLSTPYTITGLATVDPESKVNGISSGATVIQNTSSPEMIFPVGYPYVSSVNNGSYSSQIYYNSVSFTASGNGSSATLPLNGDYQTVITHLGSPSSTLSPTVVKENFTIVVTNKGTNTTINVGDLLSWTNTSIRTISIDSTGTIATLTSQDLTPFTANILENVFVENADNQTHALKTKVLINANLTAVSNNFTTVTTGVSVDNTTGTSYGQVLIQNSALVSPGNPQTLYLCDVKNIVKIIDTKNANTSPNISMLSNPYYDVTNNYKLDNGQRDSHYDFATITLVPGAPQPQGNILIFLNYYQHTSGDGYFSVMSYLNSSSPEQYQQIPNYVSSTGTVYSLRDCLDFRPALLNAQTQQVYRYANSGELGSGTLQPLDNTIFTSNYSYYLGRQDKLVLTKDRSFSIIQGTPSINPTLPSEPNGSLVLANITLNPYTGYLPSEAPTGYVPDLSVSSVSNKSYTMSDIATLETRINQIEYYSSLNLLEQNAQSLQISDAYGLNRFKNGILVDDFSSYATADTQNPDYSVTINRRLGQMTAMQNVQNFPLKNYATVYSLNSLDANVSSSFNYAINSDGYVNYFSLPYTTANAITQKLASRVVNVNPFSYSLEEGVLTLSPNTDNWVDTNYAPSLLITDPNLQIFQANSNTVNVLSAGDWKAVSGTTYSVTNNTIGHGINPSPYGYVGYSQTTSYTTTTLQEQTTLGAYSQLGNTYSLDNGYITDVSILPYIRPQQVIINARGMLHSTNVTTFFDSVSVNNYVRKTNIVELTAVSGQFNLNDVVGYYVTPNFYPVGIVVDIHYYPNSSNVRLYIAADGNASTYTPNGVFQNGFFNSSGVYISSTGAGNFVSSTSYAGVIQAVSGSNVTLSPTASSNTSTYLNQTLYVVSGTGSGSSATITAYNPSTKVATLSSAINCLGSIYSIGNFSTNEDGNFSGIFCIPANSFHTGQRVFRVDNSINGNANTATTYCEGTYYAEGLQTTSQGLDFGASPAGAAGTFTQTNQTTTTTVSTTISPWDPIAQTFIVSSDNFPNGLFLTDIKLFFQSIPTLDNSPITLSILNTTNGFPNGTTLDYSVVTLYPNQINVSQNPQYLDPTTYTTFNFNAPVYIQPNVLYAFMLKSASDEYNLWTASNGDVALPSSVKNLPTDATPSSVTKIGSAPYVGGLFISQNAQTWNVDQNQSLMFVADQCIFNTSVNPKIQFVVPNKLPQRTLVDQSIDYYLNANNVSSNTNIITNNNVYMDAINLTTTDFVPTTGSISYTYNATLLNGSLAGETSVTPGKYGTAIQDDIYLNDGNGVRVLNANSNVSFLMYATLSSTDPYVSPIVSDSGLSLYSIDWNINNCGLSNNLITIISGGTGYNVNTTSVTITGNTGSGALATANIANGTIVGINITNPGSGYLTTPTIRISDANTTPGTGANVVIVGETSASGGPATAKYVTKKVVLAQGNDSGDLNVYLTAYRPVNTDINVYYKILSSNDPGNIVNSNWQLMTKIQNSGVAYSQSRTDLYEYVFAPGTNGTDQGYVSYTSTNGQTYNTFIQFAIKVVLTTSDPTSVPFLTDIRCIALPANVNNSN